MNVSQLFIYPIKSAAAIEIQNATLDTCGFKHDRRFMIVDSQGRFCTQRDYPMLACVYPRIEKQNLIISSPKLSDLIVPLEPQSGPPLQVHIWKDQCNALAISHESSLWFSELLQISCSLVYLTTANARVVDTHYAKPADRVAFADAFPLLLTSTKSLEVLNQRLHQPITMHRFRPNIVIDGAQPFAEDYWRVIELNEISFRVAKACSRCVMINVDPTSGTYGFEPLRTLATFRTQDKKVYFGQNLIHNTLGTISVGNTVHILEEQKPNLH